MLCIFLLIWKEWSPSKGLLDTCQVGRREPETPGSLLYQAFSPHVAGLDFFNGCWFRQTWSDTTWFGSETSPCTYLVWTWACWGSMQHTHRCEFSNVSSPTRTQGPEGPITMTKWHAVYISPAMLLSSPCSPACPPPPASSRLTWAPDAVLKRFSGKLGSNLSIFASSMVRILKIRSLVASWLLDMSATVLVMVVVIFCIHCATTRGCVCLWVCVMCEWEKETETETDTARETVSRQRFNYFITHTQKM